MVQHVSSGTGKNTNNKKLITLVVGIVVLAVVLTICGTLWYVKQTEKTKLARRQCEVKVAQVMKASNTWKTLIHNDIFTSLADDSTPEGMALTKILKEKAPSAVACTANSPEELGAQGAQAVAASEWYVSRAKEVRKIAFDILNKDNDYLDSLGKDQDKDSGDADSSANQNADKKEKEKQEIRKLTGNVIRKAKLTPGKNQVPSIISKSKDEPIKKDDKKDDGKKDGKGDGKGDSKDSKGDGKGDGKDGKDSKNPQLDPKTLEPEKTNPKDSKDPKNPKDSKPGTANPSTTKPGTANPSTTKPGTANPSTTKPGTANQTTPPANPSTTKPGTTSQTTPPANPSTTTKPGATNPPATAPKDGKKSSETGGTKHPDIVVSTNPSTKKN
ncbi:ATPase [Bifidobacteriaceae bacterium NR047]|nr:ATPase [Bifidobacteriaceae bacterium NR047]